MTITQNMNGRTLEVVLEGRLDTMTAPELEDQLKEPLKTAEQLVIDLEKLDYISSAGLRVLLFAYKAMNQKGGMKVTHCNEIVRDVFDVTGFSDILLIE